MLDIHAGAGGLHIWDIADLPPQTHARSSHRAYCESGEDSEEGSDGEGPIFKGETWSSYPAWLDMALHGAGLDDAAIAG